MSAYQRPDTYIEESLLTNPVVQVGATGTAVFMGTHFRGPTDRPVLIDSWTTFTSVYGGFPPLGSEVSELAFAVYNYISNGGRLAYIARILGAGASEATLSLSDRATSPASTLRVSALNEGAWGNDIRISIVDRDAANGRFDLLVYKGGTTAPFQVEQWPNLSMAKTDQRYVEKVLNSLTAGSSYIKVEDLNSAASGVETTPAAGTGLALAGGDDGDAPTQTERIAAVQTGGLLDQVTGLATINLPGEVTPEVVSALVTYAEDRQTFFVVAETPSGQSVSEAVAYAESLPVSSYVGVYYPWVHTADPSGSGTGAVRLSPPGAFVLGQYAETDTRTGVWKAPAGLGTRLTGVLATEKRQFTDPELDTLNLNHVNVIRQVPGAGTVIMGARTLMKDDAAMYVNLRRTLNYIKDGLKQSTRFAMFENNDSDLWTQITSVASRFLSDVHAQKGLKGQDPGQAFYVKCDESLNTPQSIADGRVLTEVGVALQRPAEYIVIRLGQWEGGSATSEINVRSN